MSMEENKAIVRQYVEEVINKRNLAALDEFNPPTYVLHSPGSLPMNREAAKQFITVFQTAFPDLQQTIEDMLAEEDKVVQRVTFRGTHQGEFQGIPATGRHITVTGMNISRVTEGKIVEDWFAFDALGLLQQLGVVPTLGQAGG